jgi:AAHS family 4-hydroxybenzoate transporter-like MFS transporter
VKVNVSEVVDNSKLGGFQIGLCALCALCLIMDGFDVQSMGYVAPAIVQDWHIPSSALGPVFGAAPFGVLVGSLLFSLLADKIGRRPVLIALTLFFSIATILTARANSIHELMLIRFIAGMGLGGIQPNGMALMGEYSPRKIRITMMMIVSNGFTAGAAVGGFISAWLIPAFGWRAVFYFGGLVPLLIAALMFFQLPESLQFMALKGRSRDRIGKWLRRVDASVEINSATQYVVHEEKKEGMLLLHLFRDGRAGATLLLWIINFMNLINLFFLSSWLPTVVRSAGYPTRVAVLVGTALQVGGTIGTFGLAWMIERRGFIPVLGGSFLLACLAIAVTGQPALSLTMLFVAVFIAGWCVVGGQPGVNALAATYYPTYLRSTGIGWGLGIGRIGAIVGPVVAGQLIGLKWSSQQLFYAAAVPALVSALVMFSLRWVIKPETTASAKDAVLVH